MDTTSTASTQAEAAPVQTIVTPSFENISQASEALTLATITGASAEEIQSLQGEVNRHRSQGSEQTQEEPQTEPAPETAPAETDAPPAEDAEESADNPAGDTPQEVTEAKVSERLRINHLSEDDKLAANAITLLTRKGLSLAEATQRVLGEFPKAQAIPEEQEAIPAEPAPETAAAKAEVETLAARQAELKGILKKAAQDESLYGEDIEAANAELIDVTAALVEARVTAKFAEREQAQAAVQQRTFDAEAKKHHMETLDQYPDLKDAESTLWMVTAQLAEIGRKDAKHPLHAHADDADYVKHCTALAAKKLGLAAAAAPAKAIAKPVPAANGSTASTPASRPGPASGSRSTTPQSPAPTAAMRIAQSEAMLNAVLDGDVGAYKVARPGGFVR